MASYIQAQRQHKQQHMANMEPHRKQKLKEFHKKSQQLLTEHERDYLYHVLKEYQTNKHIDRFIQKLQTVLDTPLKLNLLKEIRHLVPSSQKQAFDRLAPYHKMSPPMTLPNNSKGKKSKSTGQLGQQRNIAPPSIRVESPDSCIRMLTVSKHEDQSLGLSIRGGSEHGIGIYVSEVDEGSVADECGLQVGDQILEVNSINFERLGSSSAIKVLTSTNRLKMVIKRTGHIPGFKFAKEKVSWYDTAQKKIVEGDFEEHGIIHSPASKFLHGYDEKHVNLTVTGGTSFLGFNVRGGSEYGVGLYVSRIDKGGLAEQKGLKLGDQIIEVNGENFENVTHANAVEFFKSQSHLFMTVWAVHRYPAFKEIYAEYSWKEGENRSRRPRTAPVTSTHNNSCVTEGTLTEFPMESKVETFTQTASNTMVSNEHDESFSVGLQTANILVTPERPNMILPQRSDVVMVERRPDVTPPESPPSTVKVTKKDQEKMVLTIYPKESQTVDRVQSLHGPKDIDPRNLNKTNKKVKDSDGKRSWTFKNIFGSKSKGEVKLKTKSRPKLDMKDISGPVAMNNNEEDKIKVSANNVVSTSNPPSAVTNEASSHKFSTGMGSQLMYTEASKVATLTRIEEEAKKVLNEDEVAAILRHLKWYGSKGDVEGLVRPLIAILDKPEKALLFREIRGLVLPTDIGRFDSLVSRIELEAYSELATHVHKASPVIGKKLPQKQSGVPPKKKIIHPEPGFSGAFHLRTEEQYKTDQQTREKIENQEKQHKKSELKQRRSSKRTSVTEAYEMIDFNGAVKTDEGEVFETSQNSESSLQNSGTFSVHEMSDFGYAAIPSTSTQGEKSKSKPNNNGVNSSNDELSPDEISALYAVVDKTAKYEQKHSKDSEQKNSHTDIDPDYEAIDFIPPPATFRIITPDGTESQHSSSEATHTTHSSTPRSGDQGARRKLELVNTPGAISSVHNTESSLKATPRCNNIIEHENVGALKSAPRQNDTIEYDTIEATSNMEVILAKQSSRPNIIQDSTTPKLINITHNVNNDTRVSPGESLDSTKEQAGASVSSHNLSGQSSSKHSNKSYQSSNHSSELRGPVVHSSNSSEMHGSSPQPSNLSGERSSRGSQPSILGLNFLGSPEDNNKVPSSSASQISNRSATSDGHSQSSNQSNISRHSEISKHSGTSKHSEISRHSGVSKHSEISRHSGVSKHSEILRHSGVSKHSEISRHSGVSKHSEISRQSRVSKMSEDSHHSKVSKNSQHSTNTLQSTASNPIKLISKKEHVDHPSPAFASNVDAYKQHMADLMKNKSQNSTPVNSRPSTVMSDSSDSDLDDYTLTINEEAIVHKDADTESRQSYIPSPTSSVASSSVQSYNLDREFELSRGSTVIGARGKYGASPPSEHSSLYSYTVNATPLSSKPPTPPEAVVRLSYEPIGNTQLSEISEASPNLDASGSLVSDLDLLNSVTLDLENLGTEASDESHQSLPPPPDLEFLNNHIYPSNVSTSHTGGSVRDDVSSIGVDNATITADVDMASLLDGLLQSPKHNGENSNMSFNLINHSETQQEETDNRYRKQSTPYPGTRNAEPVAVSSPSPTPDQPQPITVVLPKNRSSLGISVSGGKDSRTQPHVKVEKIFPGGVAAENGILKAGMRILKVDGQSMTSSTHKEAVECIRRSYTRKDQPTMTIIVLPI
ncbi:unnamed protein product [Owenia fusiformis]|uniref:Uncharacterized protein n=1 Tax=Owenia fusiformis TaxID=6347 RepID=A0A8J1T7A2_OWEFU|nr:unnamed protein product [Owenia fusiformis]